MAVLSRLEERVAALEKRTACGPGSLYPADWFVALEVPQPVRDSLLTVS